MLAVVSALGGCADGAEANADARDDVLGQEAEALDGGVTVVEGSSDAGDAGTSGEGCLQLPKAGFTSVGCGSPLTCDFVQDGCTFQAKCAGARESLEYAGKVTPKGIVFPGQNDFHCWAYQAPDSALLVGGCSRDGSEVSACSPRVGDGGLILTPR